MTRVLALEDSSVSARADAGARAEGQAYWANGTKGPLFTIDPQRPFHAVPPASSCTFSIVVGNETRTVRGYASGDLVRDLYKRYPSIKPGSLSILERALDNAGAADSARAFFAIFLDGYPEVAQSDNNPGRDYERTFLAFTDKAVRKLLKVSTPRIAQASSTAI